MKNKTWLTYKTIAFSTVGVALFSSPILFGTLLGHYPVKATLNQSTLNNASANLTNPNTAFQIRRNPTNGFNGLTTKDGRYTYVLITRQVNDTLPTPDQVGGTNSGVACIDNDTGQSIGEWYLPKSCALNYTTNIVFGQTIDKVNEQVTFDETKIFVLCGISNLAQAINRVFTSYDENTHSLAVDARKGPTIKIFDLKVNISNGKVQFFNLLGNNFYNFVYPSDGTNGYFGFNANGYIYDNQLADKDPSYPGSLYWANGVSFNHISRNGPAWGGGMSFQQMKNSTIYAFGSYLTYLTYGQNFAYHLNQGYHNSVGNLVPDEFIMSTSFINVDQSIGGLYSACVSNTVNGVTAVNGQKDFRKPDGHQYYSLRSYATDEADWPMPFGYQWVLADIAARNQTKPSDNIQYTYIDAMGNKQAVQWGSSLALTQPIISFLSSSIFPVNDQIGNLLSALQVNGRFGANWGSTNGYIIFNPKSSSTMMFSDRNIDEYRYYYVAELAERGYTDLKKRGEFNLPKIRVNTSTYVFTNLLATDQLSANQSLSYLVGIAWASDRDLFSWTNTTVSPSSLLLTNPEASMFCYDWDSLSNDDGKNSVIQPLDVTKIASVGGFDNTNVNQIKKAWQNVAFDGKNSFKNWNLVFLGGPSAEGINKMDSAFSIIPIWKDRERSFVFEICWVGTQQQPFVITGQDYLGWKLTYMRRQISFLVYAKTGYVYFTSGSSLEWRWDFSLWAVRNFDNSPTASMIHDYYYSEKNNSRFVGNVYLTNDPKHIALWSNPKTAVLAIKEITQPYGMGGVTLAFITTNGIYTGSGAKVDFFSGSINNFFAECGISQSDYDWMHNPVNAVMLAAVTFTALDNPPLGDSQYGAVGPNVSVYKHNFLRIGDGELMYSVQTNSDYLLLGNKSSNIAGVFYEKSKVPVDLQLTPATKPLLKIDNNFTIAADAINPDVRDHDNVGNPNAKLTFDQIKADTFTALYQKVLQLPETTSNYRLYTNYNQNVAGVNIIPIKNPALGDKVDAAKILIPVIFTKSPNQDLVYYAPIRTKTGGVNLYYELTGLQPFASEMVLVVLKPMKDIITYLNKNKLTALDLKVKYGSDTYNQAEAEAFIQNFVDVTDTNNYINEHRDYFGKNFQYWVKPDLSPLNKNFIDFKVYYRFNDKDKWSMNGYLCTKDKYNNGNPENPQTAFNNILCYYDTGTGPDDTVLIVVVVLGVIVAVSIALGLGIGLPMRKQHRINVLNAKITNRRIDKLSGAVSFSVKKLLESTLTIGKEFDQLKSSVRHSLTAKKTKELSTTKKIVTPPKTVTKPITKTTNSSHPTKKTK